MLKYWIFITFTPKQPEGTTSMTQDYWQWYFTNKSQENFASYTKPKTTEKSVLLVVVHDNLWNWKFYLQEERRLTTFGIWILSLVSLNKTTTRECQPNLLNFIKVGKHTGPCWKHF